MVTEYYRKDETLEFPDDPRITELCLDKDEASTGRITITRMMPSPNETRTSPSDPFTAKVHLGIDEGGPIVPAPYHTSGELRTWRNVDNELWCATVIVNGLQTPEGVYVPPALSDVEYTLLDLLDPSTGVEDLIHAMTPEQKSRIDKNLGTLAIVKAHVEFFTLPRLTILQAREATRNTNNV